MAGSDTALPTVSVITVTRNLIEEGRVEAIRAALEAAQEQGDAIVEHVIWDGASTDGTVALLKELIAEIEARPSFVPIRFQSVPDKSLYDAMNRAVEISQGEYVVFLNSDDLLASPDCLQKAREEIGSNRPDFCFGRTFFVDEDGRKRLSRERKVHSILQRIPFCHNSMLIRREVFDRFGGHDLDFRIVADYDLVLRMLFAGCNYQMLSVPIAVFHPGGISADQRRTALEMTRSWRKNYAPFLVGRTYSDDEMLNWFRKGQLPLEFCVSLLFQCWDRPQLRRAALHSLMVTLRRKLQPWRTWDYFAE
ncbi:glycosyltransferase family 2 protein [Ruegeria arenilitoris]|uniref:glycosyltransferase family 2 protein n=1 Tax=Ruegeria arenilitoris TaxID=1173585 RepID=UPI0014801F17|nr:glycosyltransferase family 2 protein [Ruegeria arenilitoris]